MKARRPPLNRAVRDSLPNTSQLLPPERETPWFWRIFLAHSTDLILPLNL